MSGAQKLCWSNNSKSSRSRWKWAVGAGAMAVCLAGVATIAGVSIAQSQARNADSVAVQEQTAVGLRQLPPPGSDAAKQLLAAASTPDWVRHVYFYQQDSELVTPQLTESFLKLLQQRIQTTSASHAAPTAAAADAARGSGAKLLVSSQGTKAATTPNSSDTAAQLPARGSSSPSTGLDLAPFVRVAHDVLSYLRFCRSEVLLQLLREFSSTGDASVEATDPDILQMEVLQLLNLTSLNRWYQYTTSKDGRQHLAQHAAADASQTSGRRRLWFTGPTTPQYRQAGAASHSLHRMLLSTRGTNELLNAMTPSTGSSTGSTTASGVASTTTLGTTDSGSTGSTRASTSFAVQPAATTQSEELTMTDMLCSIKQYSPTGLTGVLTGGVDCSTAASLAITPTNSEFPAVEIPVAFHVLRFSQNGTVLPPDWDAEQAAKNLVDVASRLYFGTGISFKLDTVRTDPEQYPYLLLPTLEGWQACTHNGVAALAGVNCLRRLAQDSDVSALAAQHVINVFVSGSVDQAAYCDKPQTPAPGCTTVSLGYCEARGPWFAATADRSPTWSEDSSIENWIFISHDMFNPSTRNSVRFWNGGGATLAHEIGHYLGLMHTHEGAQPCDTNPAQADAVLDTPPNQAIDAYAAATNTLSGLAGWCSDFRLGRQPLAEELQQFQSCKDSSHIDNVFNLQSYVPDPCMMVFTPRQVERLHWAITSFRPKLVAAYSV